MSTEDGEMPINKEAMPLLDDVISDETQLLTVDEAQELSRAAEQKRKTGVPY
jgi:hypothetical protein